MAQVQTFNFTEQASRFTTWAHLADHDPTMSDPASALFSRGADTYARSCIVGRDEGTGNRYVPAGWFQEYVRRTPTMTNPHDVTELMAHVGWERPGQEGRIKATGPERTIVFAFYVVTRDWEAHQDAAE